MKKIRVTVRDEHYSQYRIEGGGIFAVEGIGLGIAGGWWVCHQFAWHWLIGVLVGVGILTGFMWLLSMTITRLIVFGLNALGVGLLAYLVATALFRASEFTGGAIGVLTTISIAAVLVRQYDIFRHDLTVYHRLKEEQTNQLEK
jgi:hypothetical protein